MENIEIEQGQTNKKTLQEKATTEGVMIPKHRFDCVNLAFKETKAELQSKTLELERQSVRVAQLEKELTEVRAEMAFAILDSVNKSITSYIKRRTK